MGGKGRSIEGLVWVPQPEGIPRLFSIGYSTHVTEWNLATGRPLGHVDCNAGAIWSMAASPDRSKLAVGCDDGACVILDLSEGPGVLPTFERTLTRQRSRILSLVWKSTRHVVGGCANAVICMWDLKTPTGQISARMKVDRIKGEDTLIWALACLPDGTIVSGDSTGSVRFWDRKLYAPQQGYRPHAADVLCIAVTPDGGNIFTCGVDRKMICHGPTSGKDKWTQVQGRRIHMHDVLAMACYRSADTDLLVTGSRDTVLAIMSSRKFMRSAHRVLYPVPQSSHMILAPGPRLMALWTERMVEIWSFGARGGEDEGPSPASHAEEDVGAQTPQADSESDSDDEGPAETSVPRLWARLKLDNEENAAAACMSSDGRYLAVSTRAATKLFVLSTSADGVCRVRKMHSLFLDTHGASHLCFAPYGGDQQRLYMAQSCTELYAINVVGKDEVVYEFDVESATMGDKWFGGAVSAMAVSPDGAWVAVADFTNHVHVYSTASMAKQTTLPRLPHVGRALVFKPHRPHILVCATVANGLVEYDVTEGNYTPWSRQNLPFMPRDIETQAERVIGLFCDAGEPDRVWMWGASWLAFIDTRARLPVRGTAVGGGSGKRLRNGNDANGARVRHDEAVREDSDSDSADGGEDGFAVQEGVESVRPSFITHKYRSLLLAGMLGPQELVVVERPLADVMSSRSMPVRFQANKYGG